MYVKVKKLVNDDVHMGNTCQSVIKDGLSLKMKKNIFICTA